MKSVGVVYNTLMPTKKQTKKKQFEPVEKDSVYFLKLVIYVILGTFWIKFSDPVHLGPLLLNGVPLGLLIGMIIASHDHFQVDRKLEYAVLVLMTIVSYFLPAGILL